MVYVVLVAAETCRSVAPIDTHGMKEGAFREAASATCAIILVKYADSWVMIKLENRDKR